MSKAGNVQVGPGTFCHTRKQGNDQRLLGPCQKNSKNSLNKFLQAHTSKDLNCAWLRRGLKHTCYEFIILLQKKNLITHVWRIVENYLIILKNGKESKSGIYPVFVT